MKKSLLLLAMGCLVTVGFSQTNGNDKEEQGKEVKLEGVTITPMYNFTYHSKVSNESTPEYVQNLQKEVANYDVTEDPNFNGDFDDFRVIFSQTNGRIIATYDNNGKVISTFEKFKDVTPPAPVRDKLHQLYPGWLIHKDIYRVTYFEDKGATKFYQLQIRSDNDRKNIKVDEEGNIL
ncbi:MAG: hypothetical protein R3299_00825 [Arenibacter sp.]|uniref:hypothetical protein n=1 Tax=Arenibacter TaxID=178469 RepID=UPI000A391AB2|nr:MULTISPECIES: hypothetical protein [Arenibacter]MDX1326215.1 hypothetical protein [Arenibacter sp.]